MKLLEEMGSSTKRRFSLQDPNSVTAEDGGKGTWTMIYDEAFEVAMDDFVYLAFSKFTFTDAGMQNNVSHCGETQIGWYHNKERTKWGCYVGKQIVDEHSKPPAPAAHKVSQGAPVLALTSFGSAEEEASRQQQQGMSKEARTSILSSWLDAPDQLSAPEAANAAPAALAQQSSDDEPSLETPADYEPWVPKSAGFDRPMEGNWQQSVASALNFLQLGWTATVYDKFQGKTPRELNRYAGIRRKLVRTHGQGADAPDMSPATSFLGVSMKVRRHTASTDDDSLDWRNKDGKNWITPVIAQGDCGSCYTISTVHMLTARNRIRSGNVSAPAFSVSFPLFCSEYNQGCDGGYGFLQTKWSEDVGLIPAHCAPLTENSASCHVRHGCDLGALRHRATNHHYVGGYYGGSDSDNIKKELVANGPLVMSFEPSEDFMYYKNGVYKSGPHKIHQEWEQVDHAVLLVGFSKENDQPYWTMQNSWGSDWGEDGYFRMARGIDESGCESIVVAADVVEESSNSILDSFVARHSK